MKKVDRIDRRSPDNKPQCLGCGSRTRREHAPGCEHPDVPGIDYNAERRGKLKKVVAMTPGFRNLKDLQRLENMRDKRVVVAAETFIQLVACAPKEMSVEGVEAGIGPSGTRRGWRFDEDHEPNPVPCDNDPSRQHWVLTC